MRRIPAVAIAAMLLAAPAMAQSVTEKLATCLACHGESGQSQNDNVPSLGGQNSYYLLIQLVLLRDKIRIGEPMNDLLKGAPDGDLQAFADTIAKLPPPPAAAGGDAARMARGKTLAHQNRCDICHREDFSGSENVPRIGGQREDYLLKTLRGYKSGARHGYDASMADVLAPIGDAEFIDLAYYVSRTR